MIPRSTSPIRLILFDAFDTLVTPLSAPHLQYASVARQYGLSVTDDDVKSAFKQAFRTTSQEHPNYGLETNLSSPDEWWKVVVQRTFSPGLHTRVTSEQYNNSIGVLSQRLVERFGTREAYHLFKDVFPTLQKLTRLRNGQDSVKVALATNSDSRILSVLKSFGLDEFMQLEVDSPPCSPVTTSLAKGRPGPTLSYFEKCSKPDSRFYHAAIRRASTTTELQPSNVLYVGDQLYQDFWGATDAGLQATWLQRNSGRQKMGQERNSQEELAFVRERRISSLEDVVEIVKRSG